MLNIVLAKKGEKQEWKVTSGRRVGLAKTRLLGVKDGCWSR